MDQDLIMKEYNESFTKPIIRYGRFINLFTIVLCFIPALSLWFFKGIKPPTQDILAGWGLIASIFAIYAVVEPISYYPVFGLPGTYMGVLSGNIGNVRVPASAIAQETVGTTPGTKKAELVSTLGIAGSIVTNLLIVTIAAVGGAALMSVFPAVVLEAFEYVSPAIFGAMFGMFAVKNLKYGLFAFILSMIMLVFTGLAPYFMIPIAVFGTVAFGFATYKKKDQ